MSDKNSNCKTINLAVKKSSIEKDIFEIYKQTFESSNLEFDDLVFEELAGGYVNSIVKVSNNKNKNQNPIVFRTYDLKFEDLPDSDENSNGFESCSIFNRSSEYEVMDALNKHGLCTKVHAKYENGLCYDFIDGQTVNAYLMLSDEFLEEMSVKLSKLHSFSLDQTSELKHKTHFEKMTAQKSLIELERQVSCEIEKIEEAPYKDFPKINKLFNEEERVLKKLEDLGMGEIVLCHNDINQRNIIYNGICEQPGKRLSLIDFELVMNNYAVMELGYLFFSICGHFLDNFNCDHFPTKEYRLRFLRRYLNERRRLAKDQSEDDSKSNDTTLKSSLTDLSNLNSNSKGQNSKDFDKDLTLLFIRTNLCILYCLLFLIKELPLYDMKTELKTDELAKVSKGDKYFYGRIALNAWKIFDENRDEFMNLADSYLEEQGISHL